MYSITEKGPLGKKVVALEEGKTTVLKGGSLIDGTGREPLAKAVVIVEGERITAVSQEGEVAIPSGENVETIDTSGQVIIPGLIECHIHLRGGTTYDPYRKYLVPPEGLRVIRAALEAYEMLAAGFTTIRDFGGGGGLSVKGAINGGLILGPRIIAAITALSPTGGHGDWHPLPYEWVKEVTIRATLVDGVDECRKAVRLLLREGADVIKLFTTGGGITNTPEDLAALGRPEFTVAELEAMVDEAHRKGTKVAAHAVGARGVREAVLAGVDTIEHGCFGFEEEDLLDLIAEKGVTLVPTLTILHLVATRGEEWGLLQGGIEKGRELLEQTAKMVKAAHDRGVRIAVGTDAEFAIGENALELELMVEAGLSPMQAIVAGTQNGAIALGLEKDIGTVEPGKLADILVLTQDPLQDIRVLQNRESIARILKSKQPLM